MEECIFNELINNIPESFLKSFYENALDDVNNMFNDDNYSDDHVKIAYHLYRAYCVGFTIGNIEKISKK